jgi:PAS domain S-box-containing protein
VTDDTADSLGADDLRRRAEARLARQLRDVPDLSREEVRTLFHELQTHQIELEMQNEELGRAQEELIEARDRYSDLYDFAPIGYITIDAKGLILQANLTAAAMLVVERGQLIAQRLSAYVVEADQDVFFKHCRCLLEPGHRQTCELRMRKRSGEQFWATLVSIPAEAAQADGPSFRIAISDVTQRKQTERKLVLAHSLLTAANQQKQLQPLLVQFVDEIRRFTGCAGVGVRLLDSDGTIPYEALEGFSRDFFESESLPSMKTDSWMYMNVVAGKVNPTLPFYTEAGSFFSNATTKLLATVTPVQRGSTPNACIQAGYESVALVPIRLGEEIIGLIHVADPCEDQIPLATVQVLEKAADQLGTAIQRIRVEEQLRTANEDLERRVAERTALSEQRAAQLQALALKLTQAEHRERRRLARVLHDHLQQLLVGARMHLGIMGKEVRGRKLGDTIADVDELLDEALAASRSLTVELSPPILHTTSLAAALEWLGAETKAKHGLTVAVDANPEAEPDDEDMRLLLFEAVRELLFNVVKHAGANAARVEMARIDDGVRIAVSDDGGGFQPAGADNEDDSGSGLGLFSISERLGLLGGRLEVESAVGRGVVATLSVPMILPASGEAHPADGAAPETDDGRAAAANPQRDDARRTIRVLLVDDQQVMLDGLNALLAGEADIEVVAQAADGQTAVGLARAHRPDIVVMDVSMPGMDGIEATRFITAGMPSVRVIGLSMHQEKSIATKMLDAGAAAYLTKDGLGDALATTIRAVSDGREPDRVSTV